MDQVDCIVVGAGVVGLAVARALALAGREVVIVEQAGGIGTGVSSRSSEVVHAGLYGEPGSLKARLCVRGKQLLYDYCAARGVPVQRTGKLIVTASSDELPRLFELARRARLNGVSGVNGVNSVNGVSGADDLAHLQPHEARELEPELICAGALLSPSSGIVDSHALMTSLLGDAEAAGAVLALASPFRSAQPNREGWRVRTGAQGAAFDLQARWLINCAGLFAQHVARAVQGFPSAAVPAQRLAKGHYFSLAARAPFRRLIYPLPGDGGLGVHLTLDLGGQARFGPDVEWLPEGTAPATLDYRVDPQRAAAFYASIRRYWPVLPDGALQPAYAGVRPKLSGPGQPASDFRIDGPARHGCAGLVQLFGIESPGLTAALAIAEHVAALVGGPEAVSPSATGDHR